MTPQLTHEELERMRELVFAHDKQTQLGMKEFDLNKPAKEPYRFQKFPSMVYDLRTGKHKIVYTEQQLEKAIAEKWSLTPQAEIAPEPEPSNLDAETLAEVAAVDAEARKPKKK